MDLSNLFIIILLVVNNCFSQNIQLFSSLVHKNSIIKTTNVTRISDCYFKCWDAIFGCSAIGFLPSELNKPTKKSVTCYIIDEQTTGGDTMVLETMKMPHKAYKVGKLVKNGIATQSTTYGDRYASKVADGDYTQNDYLRCSHTATNKMAPWWKYVVPNDWLITMVELYNRNDCCEDRLNNCGVYILRDSKPDVFCGNTGSDNFSVKNITCIEPQSGNGIKVDCPHLHCCLLICEMDIHYLY